MPTISKTPGWEQRMKNSLSIAQDEKFSPRKFSGKIYWFWLPHLPRYTAEQLSNDAREFGYRARIMKVAKGYEIYVRRK